MAEVSLELIQAMLQKVLDVLNQHTGAFQEARRGLSSLERAVLGLRQ